MGAATSPKPCVCHSLGDPQGTGVWEQRLCLWNGNGDGDGMEEAIPAGTSGCPGMSGCNSRRSRGRSRSGAWQGLSASRAGPAPPGAPPGARGTAGPARPPSPPCPPPVPRAGVPVFPRAPRWLGLCHPCSPRGGSGGVPRVAPVSPPSPRYLGPGRCRSAPSAAAARPRPSRRGHAPGSHWPAPQCTHAHQRAGWSTWT